MPKENPGHSRRGTLAQKDQDAKKDSPWLSKNTAHSLDDTTSFVGVEASILLALLDVLVVFLMPSRMPIDRR